MMDDQRPSMAMMTKLPELTCTDNGRGLPLQVQEYLRHGVSHRW